MSNSGVLQDITLTLRRLLFDALSADADLRIRFTSENNISLDSPAGLAENNGADTIPLLSLYLYQVLPDPFLNNRSQISAGAGQQRFPPLSLHLSYLLTPVSQSPTDNLLILGVSMQVLAAYPIVAAQFLNSDLRPTRPEMRLTLNPINLEELTRIWSAFNQPYRLSVCYQVNGVSIDSIRPPQEEPPVTEALLDVHQILPVRGGTP